MHGEHPHRSAKKVRHMKSADVTGGDLAAVRCVEILQVLPHQISFNVDENIFVVNNNRIEEETWFLLKFPGKRADAVRNVDSHVASRS